MTVDELIRLLTQAVVYAGTLGGSLTGIAMLLQWLVVRPMRSFVQKELVVHLVEIRDQLKDNTAATERLEQRLEAHVSDPAAHSRAK